MKKFNHTTLAFYAIAVVVSIVAVYFINNIYNPPQPLVHMSYNSISEDGIGFVNNTLSYPIQIKTIYCVSNGEKFVFGSPNNNTINPGANVMIVIGITGKNQSLPSNCNDWKVSYEITPYQSSNGIFSVKPTVPNTVK